MGITTVVTTTTTTTTGHNQGRDRIHGLKPSNNKNDDHLVLGEAEDQVFELALATWAGLFLVASPWQLRAWYKGACATSMKAQISLLLLILFLSLLLLIVLVIVAVPHRHHCRHHHRTAHIQKGLSSEISKHVLDCRCK
mmetsp:Transcript_13028/g.26630  ORF Transcript_13028/g.26630 Transcript_13028/m.26630 type:complete len:139 (+) Transcript_13028:988-1404(+)